jgi:2'-5' RNA ligase
MRLGEGGRGMLRLVEAESLHLTLCFLGSRPVAEIDSLADALASCPEGPFELSVGAPLWLPARRPRTLAVEIHDRSGALGRLQARVSGTLAEACSWQPERRRFRPHVTLARVRQRAARGRGEGFARELLPATPRLSFIPEEVVLYRSWLAREGASYQALGSCRLVLS